MRSPYLITTPYPTLEETAKLYGMSEQDVQEVVELMESIVRRREASEVMMHPQDAVADEQVGLQSER